jgi:hypothetical protein
LNEQQTESQSRDSGSSREQEFTLPCLPPCAVDARGLDRLRRLDGTQNAGRFLEPIGKN